MLEPPPCIIETNSTNKNNEEVSVFYRNHYLYSKYSPSNTIEKIISSLEIKSRTLILAFSPTLPYGIKNLQKKLKDNCFILAVEPDKTLYEFSIKQYKIPISTNNFLYINIDTNNLDNFYSLILNEQNNYYPYFFPKQGTFKYCLPIDFSGATQFYQDQKQQIISTIDKTINQFWTNRLTLVHLGRLYSRNLFKNLYKTLTAKQLIKNSISKPIIVFGAGESIESEIEKIKEYSSFFFIIAVDSALHFLLENNIIPDVVILVESQLAIEKAFIGIKQKSIHLIADLTSRPNIINNFDNYSFFFSEYAKMNYLQTLKEKKLLPLTIQPLGSVGIVAIELALYLKKENTNVFITGLDFSYQTGKTHCKESPALKKLLFTNNRETPIEKLAINYSQCEQQQLGKNNHIVKTIPSLLGYSLICKDRYKLNNKIFDIGKTGISLGLQNTNIDYLIQDAKKTNIDTKEIFTSNNSSKKLKDSLENYYMNELSKIKKIKNDLINGEDINTLINNINECDYLFFHFADGYNGAKKDLSFLKRVRSEVDFFIKDISFALSQIQK